MGRSDRAVPHVRPATEADLPAIVAIYNEVIATSTAVFHYAPQTLEARAAWLATHRAAGHPVFVAAPTPEQSAPTGDVLGFAAYGPFRGAPAYRYTVEHTVHVAAGARGRGVGRALLEAILRAAREAEIHAVIGGVVADNAASIALHRGLGFDEVAHFRAVGYKFGRWLDLKFFERVLDTPAHPSEGDPDRPR